MMMDATRRFWPPWRFKWIFVWAVLFLMPNSGLADEGIVLDEVVVRGTKEDPQTPQPLEATEFVTVIPSEDFRYTADSVTDVLEKVAGITIRKFGGQNAFATASIRGSSAEQVAVFIDGVPLNRGKSGVVNLGNLPLNTVERIEVYRGTIPLRFRTSAIGGAINIVTQKAQRKRHHRLKATYGSYDTRELHLSTAGTVNQADYLVAGEIQMSEGDFDFISTNGTGYNTDDDFRDTRINNDFTATQVVAKTGWHFHQDWRFDLSNVFFTKEEGTPGRSYPQAASARLDTTRNIVTLKAAKPPSVESSVGAEITTYWLLERSQFQDPANEIGAGHQDNLNETAALGVDGYLSLEWGEHQQIGLLASFQLESFEDHDNLRSTTSADIDGQQRLTCQLGVEDTIYAMDYRLQIKPQLLFTRLVHDFGGQAAFQNDPIETPEDAYLTTYKLGLNYKLRAGLHAKANAGYGHRYPNFSELFGDRGGVVGNPDLVPEEGWQADMGLTFQRHKVPVNGHVVPHLFGELSFFYADLQNMIVYEQNSQRTVVAQNADSAAIWGIEASWDIQPLAWLALVGNYTYQHTENTSDRPHYQGNQLPGRPTHQAFQRLEMFNPRIRLFLEYHYMSENYLDQYNSEFTNLTRRDLYNAGITSHLRPWMAVTFEVRNLTDELVSDVLGYPMPGTTYLASINLDL